MTALKTGDIPRFIESGGRGSPLILIFGPDEGLVRARARALSKAILGPNADALSLVELEADSINQDPPRLLDEANAISMFGGRRVVLVRQAGKLNKGAWQPLLETPPLDSIVLFQADDLAKTSALRNAFEAHGQAAAIACYPPGLSDIQALIDTRCRNAGLSITPPARLYLSELLGTDYALSESEIDKLILYCQGKLAVDVDDIDAIITDTSESGGNEPIDLAFDGKLEEIESVALKSFREGINPSGVLVLALNHALMLRRLANARQSGQFDLIFRQQGIFFRRQDRVRAQANRWNIGMLNKAIDALAMAQEQARRASALEETITIRALWSIALGSRRR